jgi:GNAT superfamily N-acetyltransferase
MTDITIRKLSPDMAEDYVRFFDETPHDDGMDESKCYCVCWCAHNSEGVDFSSREKRRELAAGYVKSGILQGYLAYRKGRAVGWVNANTKSDCLQCESWRRFMGDIPAEQPGLTGKVKSVFCFTIAPDAQRTGVASRLLERVVQDAARDGFDAVEAYPYQSFSPDTCFTGPLEMYRRLGFAEAGSAGRRLIVRKQLG